MALKNRNVAFIPVRGGSKSIPLKNIRQMNGKPLVYWTIKAANECNEIDKIYVSTDSAEIKEVVESINFEKVIVIGRSEETAGDTASTESAMLEFADQYDFENVVLIQATSPLLKSEDLCRGFQAFECKGTDSVLSVVRQKRFVWKEMEDGTVKAINYNIFNRPRRQEFSGYLVENGAFYITSKEALLRSKNRISGCIRAIEMNTETYFEIDEPIDWTIVERLMKASDNTKKDFSHIKMFLTDCDGCLTDGGMYLTEKGDEVKKFNTKDGMGFKLLKERGILTGVITGESVELNRKRAEKLQLDFYEPGCIDKFKKICEICNDNKISLDDVVYVGDDINDLEAIEQVGFGCSVANGIEIVKKAAKYVTVSNGGNGAIREIIDLILK